MPGENGDLNHGVVVLFRFWSAYDAVDGEVFFEFMLP
jgi:hypothetical protein